MNKRKHPSVDKGDKSFKSGDESQNNVKCGHINNAVDLQRIQESLTRTGFLIDCEECKNLPAENVVGDKKLVLSLWLCLKCGNQACGRRRNKHALKHFSTPRSDSHALCVNTTVWSVWCYDCHDKVNLTCSRELQEAVECLQKQAESTKIKQQIVNQALNITSDLQLSVSSSSAGNESQNTAKCGHINKAVDLERIKESLTRSGFLTDCEECKKLPTENVVGEKKLVSSLWMCLKCGNQACGRRRNKHALNHFSSHRSDSHAMCVSTRVWQVWCYDCNKKVDWTCRIKLQEAVEFLKKQAESDKIKQQPNMQQIANQASNISPDSQLSISTSSTGDENQNTAKCDHINKAVDLQRIKESLTLTGFPTFCEECKKLPAENVIGEEKYVPSLWLCLKCGNQACGWTRNRHALEHYSTIHSESHAVCVYTRIWRVWCFDCDDEVDLTCRRKLQEAVEFIKKLAELDEIKQQRSMQQIANQASDITSDLQLSDSSSSARDENHTNVKCGRINKSIDLQKINKLSTRPGFLTDCEECEKIPVENGTSDKNFLSSLWLCLKCGNQAKHFSTPRSEKYSTRTKLQEAVEYFKERAELNKSNHQQPSTQQIVNKASNITSNLQLSGSSSSSSTGAVPKATNSFCSSLPRARGLINLGNTGFFNSVLQCLGQTPYFLQLLEESSRRYFQLPGGKMVQENGEVVELSPLNGILKEWQPLTATLAETLRELQSGRAGDYNPWMLLSILISKRPQFGVEDQHDCYELLQQLLEVVREEDVTRYIASIMETFGFNYKKDPSTVEGEQKNIIKFYNQKVFEMFSPVEQVFRGVLVGNIQCQVCVHSSDHDHFFFDLSLPIPETQLLPLLKMKAEEIGVERKENKKQENHMTGNRLSIKQSLATDKDNKSNGVKKKGDEYDASMRLGTIPARNQWDKGECSVESCLNRFTRCELVLDPSKHALIDHLPAVLILHLHRFLDKRYQLTKVTKFVKFPTLLDLAPFCSKRLQNLTSSKAGQTKVLYSLYGVVEHIAMRQGGHYVAYIKVRPPLQQNSYRWQFLRKNQKEEVCSSPKGVQGEPDLPPGKWYYTSDSTVIEVQESKVLEAQAYLLFYERIL